MEVYNKITECDEVLECLHREVKKRMELFEAAADEFDEVAADEVANDEAEEAKDGNIVVMIDDDAETNLKDFMFYDDNGGKGPGVRIFVNLKTLDIVELLALLSDEGNAVAFKVTLIKHNSFEFEYHRSDTYKWHVEFDKKLFKITYINDDVTCAGQHIVCEFDEIAS